MTVLRSFLGENIPSERRIEERERESNVLSIAHDLINKKLDFNDLYGFYKIIVLDKKEETIYFLGDNAGSQYIYYDEKENVISDSLLHLSRSLKEKRGIDLYAAAQILAYNTTISGDTLIEGIRKTDVDCYYVFNSQGMKQESKNLCPLSNKYEKRDLYDFVSLILQDTDKNKVCARLTGGTDSRAVLAALLKAGCRPTLVISGYEDNPDVAIAKEISEKLGLELLYVNPGEKEERWLERSFEFSDGMFDVVLGYRQLVLMEKVLRDNKLWFGGVGGEFYKNFFCKPFQYRLFFRKASSKEVVERVFATPIASLPSWCHQNIIEKVRALPVNIFALLKDELGREQGNLARFNRAGFKLLRCKYSCLSNSIAKSIIPVEPLVDIHTLREVSHLSPLSLSMAVWQRKQIQKNFPALGAFRTDAGYSCSMNPLILTAERMKKLAFWISRVVARIKRKLGLSWKSANARYWDRDYADAREMPEWKAAMERCKKIGIVDKRVGSKDIPLEYTGRILLFGMMDEFLKQ